MATTTQIVFVDDLTGDLLPDGGETVHFALDGASYEIDLNQANADALRAAFKPYIQAGRKVGRQPAIGRRGRPTRHHTAAIRSWARQNGHDVSGRGRIPIAVVEAYEAAH
ncbi:Lsr2 family protein [Blastococcus saxobsidens]|uniref:Lsr2 family protein n=1 Tax=Blastococcus saxobsidens TaxID=138336 RepID=A0A6L9W0B4_9ACTN|nr:Lsr2 family protein [Blastococcus saxobsidens]